MILDEDKTFLALTRFPFDQLLDKLIQPWTIVSTGETRQRIMRVIVVDGATATDEEWSLLSGGWTWLDFYKECKKYYKG